jgi:site-specific DNA-methyltransferase (adenine-specific)
MNTRYHPHYEEREGKIYCGDCVDVMRGIKSESVDLVVTSPPYGDVYSYKEYNFRFEETAAELIRVIKKGAIIVWVVGDQVIDGSESGTSFEQALFFKKLGMNIHDTMIYEKNSPGFPVNSDATRYSGVFEYMFIFSKGKPKTVNLIKDRKNKWAGTESFGKSTERLKDGSLKIRNKILVQDISYRFNIWKYKVGAGMSSKDKIAFEHPAIFPDALASDHIISWSNLGDIVLDPFLGSGTTAVVAKKLSRKFIGIDVAKEYCDIAIKRLSQESFNLGA